MSSTLKAVWQRMKRKKHVDISDQRTDLKRCLTLRRLTLIGVGKTVGVGIYVLIGVATKEWAGPSVVISFLIAFLVTLLNGLCFSEYASRNPRTGAQYSYMYESVGEAVAFIVGWTSILGYTSAFSLAARGWSGYVDSMFNHAIQNYTVTHIANWTHNPPFPEYPDLPAICIVLVVMVITSIGVNFSTMLSSIIGAASTCMLLFIAIFGLYYADFKNWFNDEGGFFPYGLKGVLKASSACFYAFQGFEIVGLSAEETINPAKTVPLSIVLTLCVVTLLYLSVAVSFTLMMPFTAVNKNAPFPSAFQFHHNTWAKYFVAIGPLLALSNLCSMELFTIQRFAYSMAGDGLLFKFFAKVNKRTKVPIGPVVVFGPVVVVLLLVIDLSNLIGFMVTYTFLQYSLFAAYMIVLRYEPPVVATASSVENTQGYDETHLDNYNPLKDKPKFQETETHTIDTESNLLNDATEKEVLFEGRSDYKSKEDTSKNSNKLLKKVLGRNHPHAAKSLSRFLSVRRLVGVVYITCFLLAVQLHEMGGAVLNGSVPAVALSLLLAAVIAAVSVCIWYQEQLGEKRGFLVPLMPFLPVTCLFCNMLMLVSISEAGSLLASFTFAAIGMCVYLVMVTCDVVKGRGQVAGSRSRSPEGLEGVGLLDQSEQDGDIEL